MSNMNKCICNKDKRTQRMSSHLLKEHRTSLLTEHNINEMKSSIKHDKGYVFLKLAHLTSKCETIRLYVSFGFNSGWLTHENANKANDSITKEQFKKHIDVCKKLIEEYEKTNGTTTPQVDNDIYNEELSNKLKVLQKKHDRLEKELKKLNEEKEYPITEHTNYYMFQKLLFKCFNIDEDNYDTFIENFNYVCENNIDDIESFSIDKKYNED